LPEAIINILLKKMYRNKKAIAAMKNLGLSEIEKLKKFCWCNYGGINHEADITADLRISNSEYWDCGKRGNCQYEGQICSNKLLSKREIQFAKYLADGLIDKEIADKMKITYATACDYRVKIQKKTNTTNKVELVNFLHRENLIN
jgi:DNA-binding CsgD family transcriptional regulator